MKKEYSDIDKECKGLLQKNMKLVTGIEAEKEKCRIVRAECTLLQKKIVEHNQTIVDNNTLQLKLQCAKNECVSLLEKHSASEAKVKTTHDAHMKNVGEVSKLDPYSSKKWIVCMSNLNLSSTVILKQTATIFPTCEIPISNGKNTHQSTLL